MPSAIADLTGVNLRGATLDGVDLTDAILRSATLDGVDLTGTNLARANLTDADLTGASADGETRWPDGFDWEAAGVRMTFIAP